MLECLKYQFWCSNIKHWCLKYQFWNFKHQNLNIKSSCLNTKYLYNKTMDFKQQLDHFGYSIIFTSAEEKPESQHLGTLSIVQDHSWNCWFWCCWTLWRDHKRWQKARRFWNWFQVITFFYLSVSNALTDFDFFQNRSSCTCPTIAHNYMF